MTNITPEAKNTNRHSVLLVEKEGRNLARKYHQVLAEELIAMKTLKANVFTSLMTTKSIPYKK